MQIGGSVTKSQSLQNNNIYWLPGSPAVSGKNIKITNTEVELLVENTMFNKTIN